MAQRSLSIDGIGTPLGFRAALEPGLEPLPSYRGEECILTEARSLDGMQKEAIVRSSSGIIWRLTCDEGPYLNGADVAPFPLAFVTAGLVISVVSRLYALAHAEGVGLGSLHAVLDNYYSMEGSAIQGTMKGGASSPELQIVSSDADRQTLDRLVARAVTQSAAAAMFALPMQNAFSMSLNDQVQPLREMRSATGEIPPPPHEDFDRIRVLEDNASGRPMLSKLHAAETLFGVEGGAGSSLHAEQKRGLHVRGTLHVAEGGLYDVRIQLFKPIGSVFRFIGDDPASGRAPSGMDYLSAGIAFCFMTQLGRYAQIVKQDLLSYALVQETRFKEFDAGNAAAAQADPLVTHVYLESNEDLERNQKLVKMGEQTCFAHAALSARAPVRFIDNRQDEIS